MAAIIPTWFDAGYLQNVLRNKEKDKYIEISEFTLKPATKKGDNYSSDMYRVTVEFSRVKSGGKLREKRSLILKVLPYNDNRAEWLVSSGVFDTELSILSETLPKMNEILARLSLAPLGAQCLHIHFEKPSHMILDDLAVKGFQMAERHLGLDLDHCLLAVKNLGRFHAASVALKEKEPTALKNYKKGICHMNQPAAFQKFFEINVTAFAEEATNWPEIDPRIADKLHKLSEVIWEKGCESSLCLKDDFNVLNHGDYWINNMMFRYDDHQKPLDHIFVDFQISNWCSPAVDILYFLGSSPSYDVRFNHRESLLREYHSSLTNTMTKLHCTTEPPSFDELQAILQKRAFYEVIACLLILPVVTLEKDEVIEFGELLRSDEKFDNPGYRGKFFKKIMIRLLPLFDSMGLLDA